MLANVEGRGRNVGSKKEKETKTNTLNLERRVTNKT